MESWFEISEPELQNNSLLIYSVTHGIAISTFMHLILWNMSCILCKICTMWNMIIISRFWSGFLSFLHSIVESSTFSQWLDLKSYYLLHFKFCPSDWILHSSYLPNFYISLDLLLKHSECLCLGLHVAVVWDHSWHAGG